MAKYEDPKITVSLDDESKELLRDLIDAVNKLAPVEVTDVSFADPVKRLVEGNPDLLAQGWGTDGGLPNVGTPVRNIGYGGRNYRLFMEGEGDYLLHDDNHEGEELE